MSIATYPELVCTLDDHEQQEFSKPFHHDWEILKAANLFLGIEEIAIRPIEFWLPESYVQFFPAIALAIRHERAVRGDLALDETLLTIRQNQVSRGRSQQQVGTRYAHQDSDGKRPERFYTISDNQSTHYYPEIPPLPAATPSGGQAEVTDRPYVAFDAYDLVHASALTYHRSPPMPEGGMRTFLRLTFKYEE